MLAFVHTLTFGRFRPASRILAAAKAGNLPKAGALLAADPTLVNVEKSNGATPLWIAAEKGHLEVVKLLLEKGAAIEAVRNDGVTRYPGRQELGEHRATVDAAVELGVTSLWIAAQKGHLEVVKLLLERGALIEAKNSKNITPLLVAAEEGRFEVVKLLLEKGALIEAKNSNKATPLWMAAQNGHLEIVALLLEKGAAVDARTDDSVTMVYDRANGTVSTKRNYGVTPLWMAAQNGHIKVVASLLKNGANPNVEAMGRSALQFAVEKRLTEIAELLRKAGAK